MLWTLARQDVSTKADPQRLRQAARNGSEPYRSSAKNFYGNGRAKKISAIEGEQDSAVRRPVVQRAEQHAEGDDDRGDDPVDHGIDAPLDLLKARAGRGNR